VHRELLLVGDVSAIEKKYDTAQYIIWILKQLLRGEAMPFPRMNFIKILGVEYWGLVWTVKVD
jgi:hypothetical protein